MKWLIDTVRTTRALQRIAVSVGATILVTLGVYDYLKERTRNGSRSRADGVRK